MTDHVVRQEPGVRDDAANSMIDLVSVFVNALRLRRLKLPDYPLAPRD